MNEETAMARTPQEIFQHHGGALGAGDVDEIMADYTDDSVLVTPRGVHRGKDEIRQWFTELLTELPNAKWDLPTVVFEGDVLLIEWTAETPSVRVTDGIDTVVFGEDSIRAQTVRYTPTIVS
jgi:ketosteroid isomerase-like protein